MGKGMAFSKMAVIILTITALISFVVMSLDSLNSSIGAGEDVASSTSKSADQVENNLDESLSTNCEDRQGVCKTDCGEKKQLIWNCDGNNLCCEE